jgi:selenocysteine lyase/cysteine desulfurase
LLAWGVPEVSAASGALNRQLAERAAELGFSAPPEKLRAPHYLCLRREAGIPREFPEILARERVFVSVRGSSIRVTPHVYNTADDVERLINVLGAQAGGR